MKKYLVMLFNLTQYWSQYYYCSSNLLLTDIIVDIIDDDYCIVLCIQCDIDRRDPLAFILFVDCSPRHLRYILFRYLFLRFVGIHLLWLVYIPLQWWRPILVIFRYLPFDICIVSFIDVTSWYALIWYSILTDVLLFGAFPWWWPSFCLSYSDCILLCYSRPVGIKCCCQCYSSSTVTCIDDYWR